MGTYRYIFRDTCRLFFRHWGLSLLTLFTAAAVFFLLGGSSRLALYARKISQNVQSSLIIQKDEEQGLAVVGAMYDIESGKVEIFT